jgi:hypothetical protein
MGDNVTRHRQIVNLIAGEDLEPFRRVKWHSTAGEVVYADEADGDGWIGVTNPGPDGDAVADGYPIDITLRAQDIVMAIEASEAFATENAACYPADDGKVQTSSSYDSVGTLFNLSTASAAASIVLVLPAPGSGAAVNPAGLSLLSATAGGVPYLAYKLGVVASGDTAVITLARKSKPLLAWAVLRNATTTTNVKIKNASTDLSAVVVHDTTDENQLFHLNDAVTEMAAASTVYVNLATTATAPGVDTFLLLAPVA